MVLNSVTSKQQWKKKEAEEEAAKKKKEEEEEAAKKKKEEEETAASKKRKKEEEEVAARVVTESSPPPQSGTLLLAHAFADPIELDRKTLIEQFKTWDIMVDSREDLKMNETTEVILKNILQSNEYAVHLDTLARMYHIENSISKEQKISELVVLQILIYKISTLGKGLFE